MTALFASDSETFLPAPGRQAPPLVCLQFKVDNSPTQLIHARDPACKRYIVYALEHYTLSWHNAAYDMSCIPATWPDLLPLVFLAYAQDRVACTLLRQRLIDIALGRFKLLDKIKGSYALDGVAKRLHLEREIDKEDPWRARYGTLFPYPVSQWPEDARRYAINDADAQYEVHTAQDSEAAQKRIDLSDQWRQARADFALRLITCRGLRTDPVQVERYIEQVHAELDTDRKVAMQAGLVRWNGTKDTKAAAARMLRCCEEIGEPAPRTDAGGVALDEDAIELFGDEVLEAYQSFGSASARIKRTKQLRKGFETPIQAGFKSLIDTGRTACTMGATKPGRPVHAWGSQLQNPPRAPGYRECFIPRRGFLFVSVDYEGLELRTWAQVCLWLVRQSRLAEALNAGRDAHVELGAGLAGISLEEAYACHNKERGADKAKWFKHFRQTAKPGNFGFPAGMGPKKMIVAARKGYGVNLGRAFDDPEKDKPAAADVALAASRKLKAAWQRAWPEASAYLEYIDRLLAGRETAVMTHLVSKRARGGVWYTAAANGFFQGLAADLAKDAMWRVTREMYTDRSSPLYGSYLVNFVHDELIGELREDCAHEAAHRISQIMCETAQEWCPDLTFNAPPALMRRWLKDAEPTYDGNGRLIPWEPKAA